MSLEKLPPASIEAQLARLDNWGLDSGRLYRQFKFGDFTDAFDFMTRVAGLAEAMSHHPDWSNVYNRVDIYLTTHDAGGVTELDFELAAKIDRLL